MVDKNIPLGVHSIRDVFPLAGNPSGSTMPVQEPYTANRITAAWWVLTGRAYAFLWPQRGDFERGCLKDWREPKT